MTDLRTFHGFREHISEQLYQVLEQPIIHLDDDQICHHEWLVRFDHDEGLEGVFRPAEISGAIKDLDLAMLARAVLTLNAEPNGPGIAINLSGASIENAGFERSLMACLSAYTADPSKLVIELTETWNLKSLDSARNILTTLQERGHPICLDDVGAGAASLRYLRALPADWLKVDGEFVRAAMTDKREHAVLSALLSLREPLGVKFIAEGVETEEVMAFVRSRNFEAAQGYAIAKPSAIRGIIL